MGIFIFLFFNTVKKMKKYNKILIKLSGESLGKNGQFHLERVQHILDEIVQLHDNEVQIGIVVGGGNFIRGAQLATAGIPRQVADDMGMLGTVINALLFQELLAQRGKQSQIYTAREIQGIGSTYHFRNIQQNLMQRKILIFAAGTGHPYFTTDTGAALRAVEMGAQCLFKATKVDGVYNDDPHTNPKATKFDYLTYQQVLTDKYRVMDLTAVSFCMENHLPILVFDLMKPGNLLRAIQGENVGTLITDCQN